jgi:uncharacterized protein
MRRLFENSLALRQLLAAEYRKPTAVVLIATVLSATFKTYGSESFYLETLSSTFVVAGDAQFSAALFVFASAFFLLGVVPLLAVRFVLREPVSAYGVQIGDFAFGCKAVAVIAPVVILLSYFSASMPEFRAQYPLNPLAGESPARFLQHAVFYLFFYLGWEFCFRGFLQFGLRDAMGDWNAILVQTALSCILHLGKPSGEIYGSMVGALVWGIAAFRSRSLLYPILTHWLLGLSLDFFIVTS